MKQDPSKAQVKRPRQEEPPPVSNSISTSQQPDDSHLMGMHPSRRRRMLRGRVDVPGNNPQSSRNHHQPATNYPQSPRSQPHASRNYPQAQYQGNASHRSQGNQPSSRSNMVPQSHQQRSYSQQMNSHRNMSQQAQKAAQANRANPPPLSENAHIMAGAGKFNAAVVPIPPEIFQPPPWLGRPSQQFCFEVFAGKELVNRFPIWTDKILVIGRQPDCCNIVVNHVLVSRRHAIILFHEDNGELMVYDVGSTHGTFLNDMSGKIPENDGLLPRKSYVRVRLGWRIMFGKCAYQYSLVTDGPNPHWKPPPLPPAQQSQGREKTGGGSTHTQGGGNSSNQQVQQSTSSSKPLTGIARFLQHSAAARGMFDKTDG